MSVDEIKLKAALADKYTVESKIGAGGMAIVFVAHDLKHNRKVAVKVMRPELGATVVVERFLREINIAARLNHPHILPLHDSGKTEEFLYYVMPFVEGETLRDLLQRETQLSLEVALRIATQVADGLAHAHAQEIVHRDVKPTNVLLSGEHAVIADFGIAKAFFAAAEDQFTATGVALGTPEYMSPEQAAGAKQPDARSDIYSLGCMVYEMLAGEPPFTGPTAQVVMARHATAPVPSLRIIRTTIPYSVDDAIAKAMNKVPADRYASVTDFITDLAGLGPQPVGPGTGARERRRTIVVLPFENHSAESDTDYLSDGLSDEILTDLSTIHSLGVISRTSAMQLKGTTKDVKTIGRELGVQYVLEGSVTKANGHIRVTTKLVDAATDELLWADKFRGNMADVFEIQETISRTVVDALKVRLTGPEHERLAERPIPNIEAFEYYLRAKHEILRFTEDALQRALEYLDKGLAILGDNVLIQAAIGYVNWQYVNAGISGDRVYLDRARECAERISMLEPGSPDGHRLLGLLELHGGTPQGVAHHLKIALEQRPNDTDALLWLSLSYGFAGHAGAAQPLVTRLLAVDPLTSFYQMLPGFLALMEGDFEGAVAPFLKAHELEPENPIVQTTYGQILAMNNRLEDAYAVFDLARQAAPDSFFARVGQFYTHSLQGDKDTALATVNEEIEAVAGEDLQYSWSMAECFALVGETGKAVGWIRNAVEQGLWNYPLIARYDPFLASIREDEAFKTLMNDLKEKWDTFEV